MLRTALPMLLLTSVLLAPAAFAADAPPDSVLGFGRNATEADMRAKLGDDCDESGNASSRSCYYSYLDGMLNVRFDYLPGDARIQTLNFSFWPSETQTVEDAIEALEQNGLNTEGTEYLQWYAADFERAFGISESSVSETWLSYMREDGGSIEFYLSGEPARCTDITLTFGYQDVPAEFQVEVPEKAMGRKDLHERHDFFGVPLGCKSTELARIKGEPVKIEDWSADYPDWYYSAEKLNLQLYASLSKVGEWDAEYKEDPNALLLNRVTLEVWSLDDIRDLDAELKAIADAGWDDDIITMIGQTRGDLREMFGDPDSWSSSDWTYEVPGENWMIGVIFRFSGKADHARITSVSVNRW